MTKTVLKLQPLRVLLILSLVLSTFFTQAQIPQIASTVPANGAVGVTPTSTYLIAFDEPVSKVNFKVIRLMRAGKPDVEIAAMNTLNLATDSEGRFVIQFTPDFTSGTIENGEQYFLDIPNDVFKDADDNFFAGTDASNWSFTNNYLPTNITFDNETIIENIAVGSSAGGFSATDQDTGQTYTYSLVAGAGDDDNTDFSIVNNELIVNEEVDFETKDEYRIRVAVVDDAGGEFERDIRIEVEDVDDTAPVLISSIPSNNASDVSLSTDITLTFDEDVFFANNQVVTLYLDRGTVGAVQTWQIVNGVLPPLMSVNENEITLEVANDLFLGQEYSVRGFPVEDGLGNEGFTAPFSFTARSVFTGNDILSFTAEGLIGTATIDPSSHTISADMSSTAPVYVDPVFTFSDGAGLFGSLPDQWATNELYWESGTTKTVNVRSESGSTQTWSVTLTWQALEGTYTVGQSGYFLTLSDALDELEVRGIGADVTLELMDGYNEEGNFFVDLDPYLGNDSHTTTITVEDGATSAHIFYFQFGMDGIQNFVVDGKGVLEVESVTNNFFDLDPDIGGNPCQNITFKNLIGFRDENSTATAFGGFVSGDAVQNLVIENNTLSYQGATVIRVVGSNSNVVLSGNTIRATDDDLSTTVLISAAGDITVTNNTISTNAQRGTGLFVSDADNVEISHNTIYTDFTINNQSNAGIRLGAVTGIPEIRNNIIQMNGLVRQAGLYITAIDESAINLTYNNIYLPFDNSAENYVEFVVGNVKYGVNQWESFLANHPNNTNTEVFFTNADQGDLTLSGNSLSAGSLRGIPITSIPLAIDGELRSNLGPSKGAYEYDNIATDILSFSLVEQESPAVIDFENHTIEALLQGGTSFTQVATIVPNPGATVNPASGASLDFSVPVVFTVTAEEGNTQNWTVTVTENDDVAPSVVSFNPAAGSSEVSVATDLTLTFDEAIQFSDFANPISIRYANGTQFASVPLNDPTIATISGNTLTIDPDIDLPGSSELYIIFPSGAIEDLNGNAFLGFNNSSVWNFTTGIGTITWDGTAWSNGSGPTAADNVIIDASGVYSFSAQGSFESNDLTIASGTALIVDDNGTLVVNGNLSNLGGVIVSSGASLITFEGNTSTGNAIRIRRNTRYADGRYSFVGSSVEQSASITGNDLGTFVYKYDETQAFGIDGSAYWIDASTDQLEAGRGYTQAGQQQVEFSGRPNNGTITYSGTYTEDTDDANEGWNLVANPYAAAINVGDFIAENTNTTGPVYIWDDNGSNLERGANADYIVANAVAATNTTPAGGQTRYNGHLGSAQGFFVKLNDNTATDITFTESMRVSGNNADDNFFRKEETPTARINLTNAEGLFKQTILATVEEASISTLNRSYDAQAFSASADFGLFTVKAGRSLAINALPTNWEQTQLQLNVAEAGSYTFTIELENYDGKLYLWDKQTNETIDLKQDESYAFNTQTGIAVDRFVLLTAPNEVLNVEQTDNLVFATNKTLRIRQAEEVQRTYELYNLKGQLEFTTETKGNQTIDVSHLATGIYLVFDGAQTHKIILK